MAEFPMEFKVFIFFGFIFIAAAVIFGHWRPSDVDDKSLKTIFMVLCPIIGALFIIIGVEERGIMKGKGDILSFRSLNKNEIFQVHYNGEAPLIGKFTIISLSKNDKKMRENKLVKDVPPNLKPGDKFLFRNGELVIIK